MWLKKLLNDLGGSSKTVVEIFYDNEAAVAIAKNPVCHGKTKHFKIKYYFVREAQEENEVKLMHCRTDEQAADILTMALPLPSLKHSKP